MEKKDTSPCRTLNNLCRYSIIKGMEHNFPHYKVRSYVHGDFLKKVQYRNEENKSNCIVLKPNKHYLSHMTSDKSY